MRSDFTPLKLDPDRVESLNMQGLSTKNGRRILLSLDGPWCRHPHRAAKPKPYTRKSENDGQD